MALHRRALFGLVKGEAEIPGWRQHQVLLDYGHGDAASRTPRFGAATPVNPFTPAPPAIVPGRWMGQMNGFGGQIDFYLMLYPNGGLQGRQIMMGMPSDLQGQWMFDLASSLLTMHVVTSTMGMPTAQNVVQIQVTGAQDDAVQGRDMAGNGYLLRRLG